MSEIAKSRQKALGTLLDLFAELTGLPVDLYEQRNGTFVPVFSEGALEKYEAHCQLIRSLPGGRRACEADQCRRASMAVKTEGENLTLCHAGLYNQAVPMRIGNEFQCVLLFGEMRIEGEVYEKQSLAKHREAISLLKLNNDEAIKLRKELNGSKRYRPEQLEKYKQMIGVIEEFANSLFEEEEKIKRSAEKITHELNTRLQSIIADSENLMMKAESLKHDEVKGRSGEILNSALALSTVIQNLSDFTQDYRFVKHPLSPLLYEARRVYRAEAERRGVQIHIRFEEGNEPSIEMSKDHLQLAFNNLIHNAVKYSFRAKGGNRYVKVIGSTVGRCYKIVIENFGVGILPEEIETGAIFEDEYQGKLTEKEYRTGSGKGLFFVKQVIDRHNGRVDVTSRLLTDETDPEGEPHLTQFAIFLPFEQQSREGKHAEDNCMD